MINFLIYAFYVALCSAVLLPVVWLFYLGIMTLKRARDEGKVTRPAEMVGVPIYWTGVLLDFLGNITFAVLIFRDIPREVLVSQRLQRYVDGPPGWRRERAIWWAEHFLDPYDPRGYHIRRPAAQVDK
jgi:hypothetical protein